MTDQHDNASNEPDDEDLPVDGAEAEGEYDGAHDPANEHAPAATPEDGIEPMFIRLLQQLWEAAHDPRDSHWSLAKLSKRSMLPMSTLRRALAQLEEEQLVEVTTADDGRDSAVLSAEGREVCEAFFGDAFGDKA